MRLRPRHVRTRLTLWYLAVLGGTLLIYVAGTSSYLFLNLRRELDRGLADDIEALEPRLSFAADGGLRVGNGSGDDEDSESGPRPLVEILSPDGAVLFRNEVLGGSPAPGEGVKGYSERSGKLPDGTRIRLASRRHEIGDRAVVIRMAQSEEPFRRHFAELLSVLLLALPVTLAIAGVGGYGLARRVLAPVDLMARRAEKITAERLHERLPVENADDELGHLASVFNHALARLEQSFEQLRRFTADASHELRTPLTAIRSVGEVGIQREGSAAYYRDIIGSMLEEADRLTRLVDSLLTISRADAGQVRLQPAEVGLLDFCRESAALVEVLAEEKRQKLVIRGDRGLSARVDPLILRQALINLVDNGIKYSPVGGEITVTVEEREGDAVIEIRDTGPGIEAPEQPRVFERFYRVDKARSRQAGGAGLGLPIARWAVEANGGSLHLESRRNQGCTFRIRLPLTRRAPVFAKGGEA